MFHLAAADKEDQYTFKYLVAATGRELAIHQCNSEVRMNVYNTHKRNPFPGRTYRFNSVPEALEWAVKFVCRREKKINGKIDCGS